MADGVATDGLAYERLLGRASRAVGSLFLDWLDLPEGLAWLDLGCGTGALSETIADRAGPKLVMAVDTAEVQIAFARGRAGDRPLTYRIGDAGSLEFADGEFDAVVMGQAIAFMAQPAKAAREMKRVARPGGWVGTYMWDMTGEHFILAPLLRALDEMKIDVAPSPGAEISRLDYLVELFQSAGLERVSGRELDIEVSFADFKDYWASNICLANPAVQAIRRLSAAKSDQLRALLEASLSRDPAGRIMVWARTNGVRGQVSTGAPL